MLIDKPMSSLTVKQFGKVIDKDKGKEIRNEFNFKIYSNKLGDEAREELVAIQNKFENRTVKSVKSEDNPPKNFGGAIGG